MKRLIFITIIAAMLVTACILESILVKRFFLNMSDMTAEIEQVLKDSDETTEVPGLLDKANKLVDTWTKGKDYLHIVFSHTVVSLLSEKIVTLKANIEVDDYLMAVANCALIIDACELLLTQNTLSVETIL